MHYLLTTLHGFLVIVGIGIILHYYAMAIAWGVARGWAKIPHQNTNEVNVNFTEKK